MNSNPNTSKVVKKIGNNLNSSIRFRNSASDISINYRKSFPTSDVCSSFNNNLQSNDMLNGNNQYVLTQAGLEEYSRSYYEQNVMCNHQKQSSYAQSEGYHSYVSSSDSTSTPFLDRLRQESQLIQSRNINWSQEFQTQNLNGSTNSISSSTGNLKECSESNSSTETLKWLGSMSDVSVVSQATNTSTLSAASSQLIVHSSRVHTPQRHNSESVLYMNGENMNNASSSDDLSINSQHRTSRSDNRLFPISTYIENSTQHSNSSSTLSLSSFEAKPTNVQQWQSVADRISELEIQHQVIHDHNKQNYTYLDPSKTNRVSNSTLKAFQKNAVQSYFERQQHQQQSLRLSKTKVKTENADTVQLRGNEHEKKLCNFRSFNFDSIGSSNSSSLNTSQRSSLPILSSNATCKINSADVALNNIKKNSTISSVNYENHLKHSDDINQAVNATFTSFCEIKTDNCNLPSTITNTSVKNVKYSDINVNAHKMSDSIPPPLPRKKCILRRTSSASEYSSNRDKILYQSQQLSKDLLAPMILGNIISIDDWVPERPPKTKAEIKTMLRIQSPDLPPTPIDEPLGLIENDNSLPLLPLPLETLKQDYELRINQSANRRNSFAGQSSLPSKAVKHLNINLSPPAIPMRPKIIPTPIMTINKRPSYYLPHDQIVAQRINFRKTSSDQIINEIPEPDFTPPRLSSNRSCDQRISVRKRAHNSSAKDFIGYNQTPPPLKPRMRNHNEAITQIQLNIINNNKIRNNSKASYLPRQQRDQLLDPDHGSYKMTLHELNDNLNVEYQENFPKCNLPDVLPVNVKIHNSNRNTNFQHYFVKPPHFHTSDSHLAPQSAPVLSENPAKSFFHFQMKNSPVDISPSYMSPVQSSQLFDEENTSSSMSPMPSSLESPNYTSKSTIDLKMTQVLDAKLYTNEELIQAYQQQKEASKKFNNSLLCDSLQTMQSFNECDNKIAIVRKLNMVESLEISDENMESTESLEEKSMNEKSEKQIKIESLKNNDDLRELLAPEIANDLQNIEKSEVVIKVQSTNTDKIDIACQTDENKDLEKKNSYLSSDYLSDKSSNNSLNTSFSNQNNSEEFDCEKLSKDLISHLSPSDKLHNILAPRSIKSSADYISDLFKISVTIRPVKKDVSTSTTEKITIKSSMEIPTPNSAYFSTSEPKAKLMARYGREMTLINNDSSDLTRKKEELVQRLTKKLKILEAEQTILAEESSINDDLGDELTFKVAHNLKPADSTKFRSYIDDIGYVTMLLLSLSGRLARIENALHTFGEKSTDKKILETKRDKLLEQLDEAKSLKEDIDRRGANLSNILKKLMAPEEYDDYEYFVNMKAKLIVDSREIADKIKLGEEQLLALKDTLVHSEC